MSNPKKVIINIKASTDLLSEDELLLIKGGNGTTSEGIVIEDIIDE